MSYNLKRMASIAINFTFKYINIRVQSINSVEITCKETKMEHICDKVQGLGLWSKLWSKREPNHGKKMDEKSN